MRASIRSWTSLIVVIGLLAGCSGGDESAVPAAGPLAGARPNIILIMADDMGFSDLGSYGSRILTPNLDRLTAGGVQFTQFYNAARCVPTRASLLTGLYPHQAGIGHMLGPSPNGLYDGDLSHEALTLAEGLKSAGYATYMAGKWHLTPWRPGEASLAENGPTGRGFDRFYGIIASIRSYFNPPTLMEDGRELPPPEGAYHFTDAVTDHALQYIDEHENTEQPFFLYVAYTAPHWPLHALEKDVVRYRGRFEEGWDVIRKRRHQRQIELNLIDPDWPLPPRDPQEVPWDRVRPEYRDWFDERMAVYAAMIDQMDRGIGRILQAVEAREETPNTLVVFLSDNGGCAEEIGPQGRASQFPLQTRNGRDIRLGNDPSINPGPEDTYASYGLEWAGVSNTPFRRFKSFVHEGGIATPLIVSWPSRIEPNLTHETGHIIDIMPTFLELAGASYPDRYEDRPLQPLEGRSLLPVLQGGARSTAVYGWEHEGNRALRDGDWKLVSRFPGDWELYDMKNDRLETHDQAAEMPEKVDALSIQYEQWAQRTGIKPWHGAQTPIGWEDLTRYTE
jgi:arylsulfatase